MKKLCLLLTAISLLSGCAESSAFIKSNSTSLHSDVFEEVACGETVPKGFAELRINASLKTHMPGIYSASDIHGTPDYKVLVNVDGQALFLQGNLRQEKAEPLNLMDPEANEGVRYRFSKTIRLRAGVHKVIVAFPNDNVVVERELVLNEGAVNSLFIEPVYSAKPGKRRPGKYSLTSFMEGIRSIRLTLNNKEL
jgi:hypothetical protein